VDSVEYLGARVVLHNGAQILSAAREQRVELLHNARFPRPVLGVRFSVGHGVRDGERGYLLDGQIRTGPVQSSTDRLGTAASMLAGPVGALLASRLVRSDPLAARIADRVGVAAAQTYRRLGLSRPADPAAAEPARAGAEAARADAEPARAGPLRAGPREDSTLGLRATVTREAVAGSDQPVLALRAVVADAAMSPAHLLAMFGLILGAIGELVAEAGEAAPLSGRSYVLGRQPAVPAESGPERVTLDQVGGLGDVVAQFRQIALSFGHPQVMARWGARRPQGIFLYGPPGTGKTMLARALANEIGARFREIRTPEILDKWLGASERNIKRIFREARYYREPTVLLFDEFDSIISYAGEGQDAASQAVNAVAGIFKQEMNNLIDANPNVMVVATTNFPHRVDESLTRSGRFDYKIAIPPPDAAGRAEIITKMIRQLAAKHDTPGFRMFAGDIDAHALAAASAGMTGADIKEMLRRLQLSKAMQEARTGRPASPISQDDLRHCIAELRNSMAAS
jgi:transitional endoplasmic reticulum ATPase